MVKTGLRLIEIEDQNKNIRKGEYEFHLARKIRKKYDIDDVFFSSTGNIVFANFTAVRRFVQKINLMRFESDKLTYGEVNAVGLLDEIYHYVLNLYEETVNPGVYKRALDSLKENLGEDKLNRLFFNFLEIFPTNAIYEGSVSVFDYLNSYTGSKMNTEIVLQEIILLYFDNTNPSAKKLKELFDDKYLSEKLTYDESIGHLTEFFKEEDKFGIGKQDIFDLLSTPINVSPANIVGQLEFIRKNWGVLLSKDLMKKILSGGDLIKEEYVPPKDQSSGGPAPTVVPNYKGSVDGNITLGRSGANFGWDSWKDYEEPEAFTADLDWMPNVVMIAKNTYVWLDQLSKQYGREIKKLDQIPNEELDRIAGCKFNSLWLIGVWERSRASKRIKHLMGNIDAVASAYSLYDYQIANDLGGEWAYQNLNERCRARGIRLASDMVPNHTGIYSKWVIEHPEYFIQSEHPPYPYNFSGENLSDDPSVQIRIEDQYFSKSDAAVVFQRIDNNSGEVRYIYHGNDGTNMPWNDTAQLDMLKAEVREAVIQEIFNVARRFSIIRFDAAMTLAKKHFSRLWYPEPGKGGDIPSRSDYAMTREEFENVFPVEFWREVVDRINNELPETLLLAEAFWLMEGYFVRSLGMHRVYNSAFMNMLKNEENQKYRELITNTLEFEPEILKRYVNFMSNPDEETAIKQFGTDDKYFGVAILLSTLPGLPMFAHGQVEGYSEKYGMEYQRAYYNEQPLNWLVDRHYREIFPLLEKRFLFSEVRNFQFFDFINPDGNVNQNVFAYSNFEQGQRALILFNNKYDETHGHIYNSTSKLNENKQPEIKTLGESLNLKNDDKFYYIFKETISGIEYLAKGSDIHKNGFHTYLGGFKYQVYLDFQEVYDETGEYENLHNILNGRGVKDINSELKEIKYEQIIRAFADLLSDDEFEESVSVIVEKRRRKIDRILSPMILRYEEYLTILAEHFEVNKQYKRFTRKISELPEDIKLAATTFNQISGKTKKISKSSIAKNWIFSESKNYRENALLFQIYLILKASKELIIKNVDTDNIISLIHLENSINEILDKHGRGDFGVSQLVKLISSLLRNENKLFNISEAEFRKIADKYDFSIDEFISEKKIFLLNKILEDEVVRDYLRVNFYDGVWYFSKENFEEFIYWSFSINALKIITSKEKKSKPRSRGRVVTHAEKIRIINTLASKFIEIAQKSDYKLYEMLNWSLD